MSTTVSAVLFSHITVILNYYFGAPNFDAVYVKYPIYNTVFFFDIGGRSKTIAVLTNNQFEYTVFFAVYIMISSVIPPSVKSSPKKCVNCSQLKMILSCRLLAHLFDDLFMIVVVGKHIEHTAACAPFIMLIDQD